MHNAVAGGSHFGYWYRLLDHSDGPSFRPDYCPKKMPMGVFYNNSVHSVGRFGLWVFPGYTPTVSGACNDQRPLKAKFERLVSYYNDKGAEFVFGNPIQFIGHTIWDQTTSGMECRQIANNAQPNNLFLSSVFYDAVNGSVLGDSTVIGSWAGGDTTYTPHGIIMAWDRGQLIRNISFYNFPKPETTALRASSPDGRAM